MIEFDFKRSSRRCHASGQEFKPGEIYYSALVEEGDELLRRDFSQAAWQGPPDDAIGWWRSQVPDHDRNRVYWAPSEVLLAYFQKLSQRSEKKDTLFVMSLLLQRKRLLSVVETHGEPAAPDATVVRSAKLDADIVVASCTPTPDRIREIQAELCEHLFTDQPELEIDDAESNEVEPSGSLRPHEVELD